ncbi:MAG TPA: tRNA (N6-isopentenyl adenosine(37)-C2)-methylthiotransferase MiaB, partial [Candidatus Hydrogenedentes bacterium]|nr:tRNA (N6-isopentenyl adenosine(37)-C2)-methylthiotransferase MiaB [Candidatus Hydrogenedentota bacterium]
MTKSAYIYTFGCQMNEHDSQRMFEILAANGYEMAASPEGASLILINTCSVRANPQNKVYSLLGQLRPLKQANPELIIGVAGCVAQQEGKNLLRRERAVDMVFGPDNYFLLPKMIEAVRAGERVVMTDRLPRDKEVQNFIPEEWVEHGHVEGCKAYVAIMKGCHNFCSFCIVPHVRGREVSREADNILREARALIAKGAKEIWLLGQNVNSYRADDWDFYRLLDAASQLDGLKRLRFTSPHPKDWSNRLSDLMAARPTICNHLHLPFQAGSDRVLALMNRRHTAQEFLEKVAYLKTAVPDVEVSTDLIVGFPGETEGDFEQTLDVLRAVR